MRLQHLLINEAPHEALIAMQCTNGLAIASHCDEPMPMPMPMSVHFHFPLVGSDAAGDQHCWQQHMIACDGA